MSVFRKANQVGITAWALLRSVWGATYQYPKGIGYFLPHDSKVGDFVRQKLDPILTHLPPESAPTNTDNIGMKSLLQGDMFIRGITSEDNRQTFSADMVVFDEADLMLREHIDDCINRMEDSEFKIWVEISRPSTPHYGIDASFDLSTQNYWMNKCSGCRHDWTFEDNWPECMNMKTMKPQCPKCGKKMSPLDGRWVPKRVSDIAGYTINGCLNPNVDLKKFVDRYEKKEAIFWRSNMGVPFIAAGHGLKMKAILSLCSGYAREETHAGPTFAGADVGDIGHCVVMQPGKPKPRIVTVFTWKEWHELDAAMRKFHIGNIVVDANPEKKMARDFCKRWSGRAYMCFYDRYRRGAEQWKDGERTLNMDRTESLDASHTPLYTGDIILPREDPDVRMFAKQCENEVKITDELPDGSEVSRWEKRGENHFRHAFNYAWAAMNKTQFKTYSR